MIGVIVNAGAKVVDLAGTVVVGFEPSKSESPLSSSSSKSPFFARVAGLGAPAEGRPPNRDEGPV